MITDERKRRIYDLIDNIKYEVSNMHSRVEDELSIDDNTWIQLDRKFTRIYLIIKDLEDEIYFL